MTIQIRPTRMQLNDRFPMLGFTIRTSGDVSKYEIAIASDPTLFAPRAKPQRNRNNFYSSRAHGLLPAGRDESVFVLPPEVLVRFIGQPKLYFAVAGYNGAGPAKAEIGQLPSAASPYIDLTGLSGRSLRRVRILPSRQRMEAGYGTGGAELEWAGDAALPGLQPVAADKPNGKAVSGNPAPSHSAMPANPPAAAAKAAALADYTDGFGPLPAASPPSNPITTAPGSGHADDGRTQSHPANTATAPVPAQQHALTPKPVTPPRHVKPPYGSAVDPRAAALSDEIPLDPGNGGMSIGPDALQIGDIILSTTDAASSGLIRFGTGSPVSHAMLYVDQGQQVIEAIGSGVTMRPLADAIAHATLAVAFRSPGLDEAHRQLVADAAVTHVGEPYDKIGIVRQAKFQIDRHVCDLLSGTAAATCRDYVGYVDLGTPRPGTFFCSELVVAAYDAAGAPLTTAPYNWTSPDDLAELAFRDGALAYVGHLKSPPVSPSRSIFGLGLSVRALAQEEVAALADRFGPEVGRVVRDLLAQGVSEQDLDAFLHELGTNETAATPSGTTQGLATARLLAQQERPITIPPLQTLDGWRAKIVLAVVLTAISGPMGTAAALALSEVATRHQLCVGIGPALNAGLLEGGSLSCGIVVAPGGKLGFFGRLEEAVGTLSGVSAALQITIIKGDLDHFGGSGYAVGLDVGHIEGFGVAGGAALLDEDRHFHGISVRLGVGLEAQPVELYLAEERTYATSQGLSADTRRHKKVHTAPAQTHALDLASVSINWDDLELVPQPTDKSCWAAAGAMVVGWQDQVSLNPEKIAEITGRTATKGLLTDDFGRFANEIGLVAEPPQSYSVDGFRGLLEAAGPLWVGIRLPSSGHAIVVTGMYGDSAADGSGTYVRIADPWDRVVGAPGAPGSYLPTHDTGSRYILSWADFTREYEGLVTTAKDGSVNVQILHASGTAGRTPNHSSPPAGWAMTAMATDSLPPPPRAKVGARQMDAGAGEIAAIFPGARMTRVSAGDANISWELDQLEGLKYPNDQAVSPAPPLQDAPTIHLTGWPYVKAPSGDQISADLTVDWQYTGTALGNIRIAATAITPRHRRH